MARKWTKQEYTKNKQKLLFLYVKQNKTIGEIAKILDLAENSVYDRLVRLNIHTLREKKLGYNNINKNITLPKKYSANLAELIGIILGDGHITKTQVTVTLGTKDEYAPYVSELMRKLFNSKPKTLITKRGDQVVYFGSSVAVKWFLKQGMAYNKTKAQVKIPEWVFKKQIYLKSVLRGLIDTDGSVYRLRNGVQISFSNLSKPLLADVRQAFLKLKFSPSKVSVHSVYLTRKSDVNKYIIEIGFKNKKHEERFKKFTNMGGSYSGNYT